MPNKALALALACHPGPTVVVTAVGALLGVSLGYPAGRVALLALVVLTGQLSIGWSNDWIDARRDAAVGRRDKPVARGVITVGTVRTAAFIAAGCSVVLGLALGPPAALAQVVSFGMGWVYNVGVKNTLFSVVPYVVSFGLLPAVATLGGPARDFPAGWVVMVGALLGAAAHFTNVLPDLDDDRRTGVQGLPHVLGARTSGVLAFACLAAAAVLLTVGPRGGPTSVTWLGFAVSLVIACIGIALVLRARPTRRLMQLVMAGAVVDVVLLVLAGQSIAV